MLTINLNNDSKTKDTTTILNLLLTLTHNKNLVVKHQLGKKFQLAQYP